MPASLCDSIIISNEKEVVKGIVKEYQNFLSRSFSIRRGREARLSKNVESCTEMANPHRGLLETPGIMMYNTYLEARDGIQM